MNSTDYLSVRVVVLTLLSFSTYALNGLTSSAVMSFFTCSLNRYLWTMKPQLILISLYILPSSLLIEAMLVLILFYNTLSHHAVTLTLRFEFFRQFTIHMLSSNQVLYRHSQKLARL